MKIGIVDVIAELEEARELKKLRKWNVINSYACFFNMILVLSVVAYILWWYNFTSYPEIDYSYLDGKHHYYAEKLIKDIDQDFLKHTKKITFYQDCFEFEHNQKVGWCNVYGEFVKRNRDAYVYLTGNIEEDRETLCHELLHSVLFLEDEETYTYKLQEVCYAPKN